MGGMGRRFNLTLSEQSQQAKQRQRAIIHRSCTVMKPACAFASIGDECAWTYVYLVHKVIQYMNFNIWDKFP